jgi:hypothetical protein
MYIKILKKHCHSSVFYHATLVIESVVVFPGDDEPVIFEQLYGQVVLDSNTRIKIRVEPLRDDGLGTFLMFSLNCEYVKDCKQVNIEASFCLVINQKERTFKAVENDNLRKDVYAILGRKKEYFLAKPTDLWLESVSELSEFDPDSVSKFHVEVVIRVLYDPSSLIQDLSKAI